MTRFEFINTLRTAMHGLPADKVERIVAEHERRFEQGAAAGKTEEQIAHELGDPWDAAARARIPVRERAANGAAKAGRVFISGLGLAIFNLFMLIPATLYGVILMVLYIAGLACYFGGILITAATLAGVDDVAFRMPLDDMMSRHPASKVVERLDRGGRIHMTIDDRGILIVPDDEDESHEEISLGTVTNSSGGPATASAPTPSASAAPAASSTSATSATSAASAASAASSASAASNAPVTKVVLDDQDDDHALRIVRSIGVILGGIVLLLLSAVITRYTWIGLKRYVRMNISTLRDA